MNDFLLELAGFLERCQSGIAAIIRQPVALPQWADDLADLLLALLPQASLSACLLSGEGSDCLTIRPTSEHSPRIKRLLQSYLSSLDPVAAGVRKLPAEGMPDLQLLAVAIHENERPRGFLLVGLPAEASAEDVAKVEAFLTEAAPAVALRWLLAALQRERAELARFALLGQAFVGLGHDLNNALNSMMLQTSVVQLRADPQVRQELSAIRQHGIQAAGLVRSLQHVVQERREKSSEVDLDSVLAEILEEDSDLRCRLSVPSASRRSESGNAPRIHSTRAAVKQLIHLLLDGVCAGTKTTVTTVIGEVDGDTALSLIISDVAADIDPTAGPPSADALLWQNLDEIARHAGQALLRQLGGALTVERGNDRSLILRVIWRPSA